MEPLKKHPHTAGNKVGQPSEGVTIAAHVFSNYVLIPAAGHPDRHAGPSALHGAALLVFSDESQEQIQLRTGYASHVAGHPRLDAGKDRSDEVMSGHSKWELLVLAGLTLLLVLEILLHK